MEIKIISSTDKFAFQERLKGLIETWQAVGINQIKTDFSVCKVNEQSNDFLYSCLVIGK